MSIPQTADETQQSRPAPASPHVLWVRTIAPGEQIRQGDVYVYRLDGEVRHGKARTSRQMAPGTNAGSRHCLEGEATLFDPAPGDPLSGPVLQAHERVTLTHPEHAHISLPAGWYESRLQRDFSGEPGDIRPALD